MTALPSSSDLTSATATNAQMKTTVSNQRDFLAGLLGTDGTVATALATLGALATSYAAKTGAYTVVTGDRGKVLSCTGTWSLALPAAATAGAGYAVLARNGGTGIITIDPSGAETVDGVATAELRPGHGVVLVCTGSAWVTLALPRAQARAADIAVSEPSNLFRDFDMVDEAFYASSTGGTIQFATNATTTIGARYAYLDANASAHSMETDWFAVEPGVEYQVSGYCTLSTATAGSGTMTLYLETGSLDAAGVITSLGTTTIGTRTDTFSITPFSVAVTTGSTARRARFVGTRAAGGTAQGRMAGLKVQKRLQSSTILGTVSQSGGLPTGALIERGSNSNGEYARFADGTLICTHGMAASSGGAATWTFPSAFTAAPKVTGAAIATVLSAVCLDAAPSTTAATFSARDKADARRADTCHLHAVGRWF